MSEFRSYRNNASGRVNNELKTIKLSARKVKKESCNSQSKESIR